MKSADDRKSPDRIIDRQLSRVRRHIRFTDLVSGFMTLIAGLLLFLLVVVLVDHWLFGLGTGLRWLSLLVLVLGPAWYFATRIAPAMIRGINPAFAAQTIERSEPALKNSVVNYLLLRRERASLHEVVYQALQHRAAADVSHVVVEQTVDRSALIKAGYILVAVMGVAAAYKILSPKDPFQTVRRIVAPWSDIVRPARVTIDAVEPGDAELLHGHKLTVSAVVRGVKDKEPVKLFYSTEDAQLIDREVVMKIDPSGLRHVVDVMPEGLEQSLTYRLVAGDTFTRDFRIRVTAAPTIQVESVEYNYPAYTRRPREVVQHQGDIKAVEGTRVTIRARANQPIQTAILNLHVSKTPSAQRDAKKVIERFPMEYRETDAWGNSMLELASDRQAPKYSAYHLEFKNNLGQASVQPVTHRIEVTPDLAPEVEILTPQKQRIEIPVSGRQTIEVRAIDPDYGLSQLRLKAKVGLAEILDQSLLGIQVTSPGQMVATFDFQPKELKLAINDQVTYWVEAADNRTAIGSDSPAPNVSRTRSYHMVVVPDPAPQASQASEENKPEKENPDAVPNNQPKNGTAKNDPTKNKPPSKDRPQSGSEKSTASQPKKSNDATAQPDQRNSKKGEQNEKGGQQNQPSESSKGREKGEQTSTSDADQQGAQTNGGKSSPTGDSAPMPGQGTGGQQSGGETAQQNPEGAEGTSSDNNAGAPGQGRQAQGEGTRTEPLHDGEVFEKTLNKLKRQRNAGESPEQANDKRSSDGEAGNQSANSTDPDGENSDSQSSSSTDPRPAGGKSQTKSATGRSDSNAPQGEKSETEQPSDSQENTRNPGIKKQDKNGEGKKADLKKAPNEKADNDQEKSDKGQKSQDPKPGQSGKPEGKPLKGEPEQKADKNQGEGDLQKGTSGEGGKSARGGLEQPQKDSADKEPKTNEGGKEPGSADNGESGAGQNSQDKTGSGSVEKNQGEQVQNRDHPKDQAAEDQTPQKPSDPGTTTSKKQSDSKGGQSGDRSGGGKKGSGQGAKQPGNDSAGSNSSSDDGAGKSPESGKGETADAAGNDKQSGSPTGTAGSQKGKGSGSQSTPSADGQRADGSPDAAKAPPSSDPQKTPPPSGTKNDAAGNRDGSAPTGGGLPGDRPIGAPPENPEVPAGDAANLDYANRATDLVLEYLRDQQDNPDRELLDELGWSPADLKSFLARWQKLKQAAVEDTRAKGELDESLRSLGIHPTKDTKRAGGQRTDDVRGLRESGIDSKPPPSYQDQFRAFKKGASRGAASK